jgi:hypothetical protein
MISSGKYGAPAVNSLFLRTWKNPARRPPNTTGVHAGILRGGFFLLILSCPFAPPLAAQGAGDKPATTSSLTRPCPAVVVDSKHARKNRPKGKNAASSDQPAPGCVEAKARALDVQEFFQSFIRTQGWKIGDEKTSEDSWTLSRYLEKDELLRCSKEGLLAGRVNWTGGKAFIQVTTRELQDGFTRVAVAAHYQGYGKNVDGFAPPKESWRLDSNGRLESELISALDAHFKSLRQ